MTSHPHSWRSLGAGAAAGAARLLCARWPLLALRVPSVTRARAALPRPLLPLPPPPRQTRARRSRWFVASSIIGATSMAQLKEDLEAFSIVLPAEAHEDINTAYRRFRDPPTSA
jgi:hypothetical protein